MGIKAGIGERGRLRDAAWEKINRARRSRRGDGESLENWIILVDFVGSNFFRIFD